MIRERERDCLLISFFVFRLKRSRNMDRLETLQRHLLGALDHVSPEACAGNASSTESSELNRRTIEAERLKSAKANIFARDLSAILFGSEKAVELRVCCLPPFLSRHSTP